jgi:hypothetical protein
MKFSIRNLCGSNPDFNPDWSDDPRIVFKFLNISASNGRRKMCYSSLESSHRDESNEPWYTFPRPLDAEIFGQTSKLAFLYLKCCAIWRLVEYLGIQWSWNVVPRLIGFVSMRRFQWAIAHLPTTIGCRDIRPNVKTSAFFIFKMLRHLTFGRISRHLMVVEGYTIAHWIRLIKTNLMGYSESFYDHWIPKYTARRHLAQYRNLKMPIFDILLNIRPSSDRRRTNLPPFDSSWWDGSNKL